ncbi:hypothetical protein BegalDRAFT_2680 [Beggiatoa alba B18LD]|uniref:Uncharacterized protein n=1 Tax=Beggiatoa alba B18LD TaxID=395493 RepID=I3CIS8_9GAMM|nr:hypothetical protein [Beggiatoa alba]EIJ43521.1 hypothetical protein BegalDRAFT_2680 [Beggiatoa alba B18LD]
MQWLVKFALIFLYFYLFPPIVAVILGLITFAWQTTDKNNKNPANNANGQEIKRQDLSDLITLYFELRNNYRQWQVSPEEYQQLLTDIASRCQRLIHYHEIDDVEKNRRLSHAWRLLRPNTVAYWEKQETQLSENTIKIKQETVATVESVDNLIQELDANLAPVALPSAVTLPPPVIVPPATVVSKTAQSVPQPSIQKPSTRPVVSRPTQKLMPEIRARPSVVNRFQLFIQQILLPFIWQNIGWFVGGFCFVSGSGLLVAYTDGFVNGLVVLLSLAFYTFLILWGAYQIRRQRPELFISHQVLNFLGIFLIPLNFAAIVRLFVGSGDNLFLLAIAVSCAVILWLGFLFTLKLASGSLERQSLQEYPQLFLILAGLQFALPFVQWANSWYFLAFLHILLLVGLSYAFLRFTQGWLKAIFLDADLLTYFTVSSLLYAALISFIHLTVSSGLSLPEGYAGGLLMVVCLLLFYVDSCAKKGEFKQSAINYFTFLIYGLSVVAIVASYASAWFVPTLSLAIVLYTAMVWRYLTLSPLYLLLASVVLWYWHVVLVHFTPDQHFIASVPLFVGLWQLYRLACRRDNPRFIHITYYTFLGLLSSSVAWSLYYAQPSVIGLITSLSASLLVFLLSRGRKTSAYVKTLGLIGAVTLNGIYAPLFPALTVSVQYTFLFLLLSVLWAVVSASRWIKPPYLPEWFMQASLFSAFVSLAISLYVRDLWLTIEVLSVLAGLLLSFGWGLRVQSFFYSGLGLVAGIGLLLKWVYFPQPHVLTALLLAFGFWGLAWVLRGLQKRLVPNPIALEPFSFLGYSLVRTNDRFTLLIPPCYVAMVVLWGAGIFAFFYTLSFARLPLNGELWLLLALESLLTVFIAGQLRQVKLLVVAFFLMAFSVFPLINHGYIALGFFLLASYALVTWLMTLFSLRFLHPLLTRVLDWQGGYGRAGGAIQTRNWIFYSTLLLATGVTVLTVLYGIFITSASPLLTATFVVISLYYGLVGYYFRSVLLSYVTLLTVTLSLLSLVGLSALWALDAVQLPLALLGVAVLLVVVSRFLKLFPVIDTLYNKPLQHMATLLYAYVFCYAFGVSVLQWLHPMQGLGWVFAGLWLAQFPVLQWLGDVAKQWRGWLFPVLGLAMLLLLVPQGDSLLWLATPFILLGFAYYGLPWFNRYFSAWAIEPLPCLLLSIGVLLGLPALYFLDTGRISWQYLLMIALYFAVLQQKTNSESNRTVFTHLFLFAVISLLYRLNALFFAFSTPMFLLGWSLLMFLGLQLNYRPKALEAWLFFSLCASLGSLWLVDNAITTQLVVFIAVSSFALVLGVQRVDKAWFNVGVINALITVHLFWFFLPQATLWAVLPYFALQNAIFAFVLLFWLPDAETNTDSFRYRFNLTWLLPFIAGSALLLWGVGLFANILVNQHLFGLLDTGVLLATGGVFIGLWLWLPTTATSEKFIGTVFLLSVLAIYCRFLFFGFVGLNAWDSVALMVMAYAGLLTRRFIDVDALDVLNFLLPLIALVPLFVVMDAKLATWVLLMGATYYFFLHQQTQQVGVLYLAMGFINIAFYLWIPALAQQQHLIQLYAFPAAVTVLIMTHIHTGEMKTTLKHHLRLLALTVLYTSATADVFLRPELSIFILALGLSMVGIILGIALRTRAFLYAGVIFLVVNVLGQLIQFYPEDRLSKAIILIVLGGGITISMIFFNLKREMILQRLRIMRADLAEWR